MIRALRYTAAILLSLFIHGVAISNTEKKQVIKSSLDQSHQALQLQILQAASTPEKAPEKDKNTSNIKMKKAVEKVEHVDQIRPKAVTKKEVIKPSKKTATKPVKISKAKAQKNIKERIEIAEVEPRNEKNTKNEQKLNNIVEDRHSDKKELEIDPSQEKYKNIEPVNSVQSSQSSPMLIEKPLFSAKPTPVRYPKLARKKGWEGVVMVEVWVDKHGKQIKQVIMQSAGYRSLDQAAIEAIKNWQFSASKENNVAVAHRVRIPVNFQLK